MADNTILPLGTEDGDTYASDDISNVKYQRVKVTLGADGVTDGDVSSANPLPVTGTITATTGGLTDTQLRATAVPVSGTVTATTGGLTDTQLRATAVPISVATVPSHAVTNAGVFAVQAAATEADGANVTLGTKADAKSTATDTTPITVMSALKQISASVQAPPSQAVTNTGTFVVQAAEADGANVTLGAKADAKSTATDTTAVTAMQVLKQISASVQAPPSQAVTNAGTFGVQVLTACGAANTANGQVSISSAATIITSRALRRYCIIRNQDAAISGYVGIATVTSANGMLVKAGESIRIDSQALIQGIAASGTIVFSYIEFYD